MYERVTVIAFHVWADCRLSIIRVFKYFGISLVDSRRSVRVLAASRSGLFISFLVVVLSSVTVGATITILITSILSPLIQVEFINVPVSGLLLLASITAFIILGLGYWVVGGLLIHISCKLLGGIGRLEDTLIALSHSWVPLFLLALILPILILLNPVISVGVYILVLLVLTMWGLILAVCALSEVHKFSVIRAVLSMVIILILVMLLALFVILLNVTVTIESIKF